MVLTDDLLEAYYNCRKKKRRTVSAVEYEMDYERNIVALRNRINSRTYTPGKSICFIVTRPRNREVFAAAFEDRIVHHYIALRLEPLFESAFSPRTFNCRVGKGQLYGINTLRSDIKDCSKNYTKDCYIMKLDLKGFFMSIDKNIMAKIIDEFILNHYNGEDIEDLRYLCRTVVLHHPEYNCERHSPVECWNSIPEEKSLFTNGENKGIAIGNLFAQLFANFLLNPIDWYIEELGFRYHGRYVDDMYLIHENKKKLLAAVPLIRERLKTFGLRLNEKKFYLQHYKKGVEFTGSIVKPGRVYCCNRTIDNFIRSVLRINRARALGEICNGINSINSYLGILRHDNEYASRRRIVGMIDARLYNYIYIKGHYESITLKKKYRTKTILLKRIRDGDF